MIARIWHGMVPLSKADEYLDLMRGSPCPSIWQRAEIEGHGVCTAPKQR
jgi:hypothetical protein